LQQEPQPPGHDWTRPAKVIPRPEHNVSRANISKPALKVLYRLKSSGYQAFLVGGGVRDLLLGREPKDFDIVTDASPDEVRQLFRNCRLIGRRFRLAHVRFGREIIEVATFRAHADIHEEVDSDHVRDEGGRILRDNVYGDIDQDVWRRDFTANALYYNIADFSIWDYCDGAEDVAAGMLRLIGDPEARYREDPVRMLRAVRFAAKLGFRIEAETEKPLSALGDLLDDVPPARLFEETLKLFQSGHALASFEHLRHYDLYRHLFPSSDSELGREDADSFRRLLTHGLANTDSRVAERKPITPAFLFAVLLWGPISRAAEALLAEGSNPVMAISAACDEVIVRQQSKISVPRRFTTPMKDILCMQPRFERRQGGRAMRLLAHPRFRAAYDFLLLRAEAGEVDQELADWWTRLQELDPEEQRREVLGNERSGNRRPRKRRRRRSGGGDQKNA
jgi:poly(A) polymerase